MEAFLEEARTWIGTPYRHQSACKGAGCDCLGLVTGVWREAIGPLPAQVPAYSPDWGETGQAEPLLPQLEAFGTRISLSAAQPGAVVVFRMRPGALAKHLGILSAPMPEPRLIHAEARAGVVEIALTPPWQRRIAAVFTLNSET